MLKEVAYYEGRDLLYPARPVKPRLTDPTNVKAVRVYADELETYETLAAEGTRLRAEYDALMRERHADLRADLMAEYGLSKAKFDVLYSKAYDDFHSGGFAEVINGFDSLVDLVNEFNSAE